MDTQDVSRVSVSWRTVGGRTHKEVSAPLPAREKLPATKACGQEPCGDWDRCSLMGERNKNPPIVTKGFCPTPGEREGPAAFYLHYFQAE